MEKLVTVTYKSCPKCKGPRFKYHPPEERRTYERRSSSPVQVVVGKYECTSCGWQSGLQGELPND